MIPDKICELNIPYPSTEICEKNHHYACLLSQDFAGSNSELTAINQYFLQHLCLCDKYKELIHVLECVSMVEMRHMELLGKMIVGLGCKPVIGEFSPRRVKYWCGNNVNEEIDVQRLILINIEGEKSAIEAYKTRITQINDVAIQKVLARIILDEEHHIKLFEKFLTCR